MHRTRIKFCGITRPQDAIAAAAAGADAIGLIFHPHSPRAISIPVAQEILSVLPPMVTPIVLFVDATVQKVRHVIEALHVRTVQLHGSEPPEQLAEYADLAIIKAVKCDAGSLPSVLRSWSDAADKWKNLAGLLLETSHPTEAGGTGVENDWATIERAIGSHKSTLPLIAAGGLTPENVGNVVRRLRPWAVDVSTGIEESKGIKSVEKMRRFVEAVGNANLAVSTCLEPF